MPFHEFIASLEYIQVTVKSHRPLVFLLKLYMYLLYSLLRGGTAICILKITNHGLHTHPI